MITLNYDDKVAIITCLKELDCCSRCILRFLGVKIGIELYINPEVYIKEILNENQDIHKDLPLKKFKRNPCRTCLDVLQDSTIRTFSGCIEFTNINKYHYPDFVTCISFPKSLIIRNHSMYVYLKQRFPEVYSDFQEIGNLKQAFKVLSAPVISQIISKTFNPKSKFILSFKVIYEDNDLEIQNINQLNLSVKKGKPESGNNVIMEILNTCEDALFQEHFIVPPDIPVKQTEVEVHCMAESIWIGGRYLKFSRNMGQTPWIINTKIMTEYNIQDIIFDSIEKVLGYKKDQLTFCASGREDFDVRMLGNGRPFYIQIDDPKDECITFNQCRAIEKEVFELKLAAIVKLQKIPRQSLRRIKDGEQNKRKHYYALCETVTSDMNNVVNIINAYKNEALEIFQKTPLRVLHRRTQDVRKKYIYNMEAKIVAGHLNLIEINLITEAGTYVKEFINGDFQRTQPNLQSILNLPIDVVALDVTNIDLPWPEE